MPSDRQDALDFETLLRAYLDICNQSLKGGQSAEVKDILAAALSAGDGKSVEFLLRDDRPKSSVAMNVQSSGLSEDQQGGVNSPAQKWVFDYSHLKSVVDQPDLYIKEPERLDWSWLYMLAKADRA